MSIVKNFNFSKVAVTAALPVAIAAAVGTVPQTAEASPINGTGNLVSNVIFGSGNFNGSFSGITVQDIELALRGKLRYDNSVPPQPQSIYNYDGDRTYTFSPADGNPPAGRSIFNIDWSVNSSATGAGSNLASYIFALFLDYDPTVNTAFAVFDGVVPGSARRDHSFGTNATAQSAGTEAAVGDDAGYNALIAGNNVVQNSWNMGFGGPPIDPQTEGQFTAKLEAYDLLGNTIGSTSIDIIVGNVPTVPAPAPLALLGLGLAGLTLRRRR